MGHYCYFCENKLSGGYVPTCCYGYESVCKKCMKILLDANCPIDLNKYVKENYKIVDGNIVIPCDKIIEDWLTSKSCAKCPICKKQIDEDSFGDY